MYEPTEQSVFLLLLCFCANKRSNKTWISIINSQMSDRVSIIPLIFFYSSWNRGAEKILVFAFTKVNALSDRLNTRTWWVTWILCQQMDNIYTFIHYKFIRNKSNNQLFQSIASFGYALKGVLNAGLQPSFLGNPRKRTLHLNSAFFIWKMSLICFFSV